jgi:L-amino acid N-acyltransferase YncA
MIVRAACEADAGRLAAIYNPYILKTTVTYEYEPVSVEAFRRRMAGIMEKFPYIVAEENGVVVGYAYASPYHSRQAYSWDCDLSVYVDMDSQGKGVGTELYSVLLKLLERMNYINAYSLVDYPNDGSMALHEKFGFTRMGVFRHTAYKFGHWLDMIVLEKRLTDPEVPLEIDSDWKKILENI